ncbi:hypothetical protein BJ508DRAFT_410368 [Ascobolus immersus RN42]|uniref:Chromatin modification-related protein n=1 Tax=Ascobolus immersus RN42 TaxID=1160509 RepID=A0A3N4INX0_ASCIM|nr:hypothetical protein BJ508DRAFT_410368 [Ascobolus immersus RN42]
MAATAYAEDAASVLGAWIYDAANLPAEIRHLFDEIQAKNIEYTEWSMKLEKRDVVLQNFVRATGGGHQEHPEEKKINDQIKHCFKQLMKIQDQKIALVEKAMKLLDTHNSRLVTKMAELTKEGLLPEEATPVSAHPAINALRPDATHSRNGSISQGSALQDSKSIIKSEDGTVPTIQLPEKKRKNPSTAAPIAPMSLPSTTGTPEPNDKRSGSLSGRATPIGSIPNSLKRANSTIGGGHRRVGSTARKRVKKTPLAASAVATTATPQEGDKAGQSIVVKDDDDAGDDRTYCFCNSVSWGNMVGCDNDDCKYEWFHWSCVGIDKEPEGQWFCSECQLLQKEQKDKKEPKEVKETKEPKEQKEQKTEKADNVEKVEKTVKTEKEKTTA